MSKHDKIAKLKEYIKNFVIKELEKDEEIDEVSTTATAGAANPMGTGIYYDTPKAFSSGSVGHKSPEVGGYKKVKEDIDVGHQDNEPDMLKSTALEIHEYGKKLYNALDKYDKMENEVDFPNWWQSKLIVSKDYLQKAYHYLDSEEKKDGVQESVNESKELDTIEKIVKSAKNFMGVGNALKKVGIKSDFQTSMGLPRYTFKMNGKRYGILNKKNVSKPDRVVGDIAFGVMESINEKKKMFPPKKMTPKQAKEYKKFIDYAKMGIEYQIDMSLFESINESQPFADFPQFPKLSRDQQESLDELFGFAESYQIFNSFNSNPKKFIQTLDDMAKIRKASNKQPKGVNFNKGKKQFVKEVTNLEISSLQKVQKGLEKLRKDYTKIYNYGDKTLMDKQYDDYYEYILTASKEIENLIRTFKTKQTLGEGRYHDWRNDESMTPKQKIGRSMREIRDALNELDKTVKMNLKLKTELKMKSEDYWKNTHKALTKISERLVKMANKVGNLK